MDIYILTIVFAKAILILCIIFLDKIIICTIKKTTTLRCLSIFSYFFSLLNKKLFEIFLDITILIFILSSKKLF